MACWWRLYVEKVGGTNSVARGSWKKRAAYAHSAQNNNGNSWPKKLLKQVDVAGSPGMPSRKTGPVAHLLTDIDTRIESSGARMLALHGGRPPML